MSSANLSIDLSAIRANWGALNYKSGTSVQTGAVVKADGYGLGATQVARELCGLGVQQFFVALAQEGASLRSALGPGPTINVFSGHMSGDTELIRDNTLIPMLNSPQQVARHFAALPGHPFGAQLDTGMNRLGLEPSDWATLRDDILTAGPTLLMSHLACADEPDHPMNGQQLAVFHDLTDGIDVPRSLAATGGVLLGPDYHFDLTRPGVGLYGGLPFGAASPVVTLSIPVIQTRQLETGETVGYSNTWTAPAPRKIATVAAGYADGLLRALGNGAQLYHGATPCPVVGRVSMDLITVDITHLPDPPQSLDILCEHQGVDQLARFGGTIGYEILTALGRRYGRDYKGSL